ncbi:MAG TPA: hypothetical protein VID48_08070 [Solirubrobacteraceae bacterium]
MMPLEYATARTRTYPPHLRLVDDPGEVVRPQPLAGRSNGGSCVLLAGADVTLRTALRRELSLTLSPGTVFIEANEAWEVLQQAPASRIVMLTGDLREVSAESITRLLGRHYPSLPVLTLDDNPVLDQHADPLAAIDSASDAI